MTSTGRPARADDAFIVNPRSVNPQRITAAQLAEARQVRAAQLSYLPAWGQLSPHDQEMATLSASNWLHTLAGLADALEFDGGTES